MTVSDLITRLERYLSAQPDQPGAAYHDMHPDVLIRDALEALRDDGWRPIETAPINKSIEVFIPNTEHYGPGIWRAILVDMGTGRRWHATALHMGSDIPAAYWPTHWRPFRAPPESS